MSLQVVKKDLGDRQGVVTIQGDSQEEVMSATAKQMAIQAGAAQLGRCGVSGNESAYPVDAAGQTSDNLVLGRGDAVVAAYRCDYNLTAGL